MTPPEKLPAPNRPDLRPNQVPWGAPKAAAKPAPPPEPAAPKLSAAKVPWGARKTPASSSPPPATLDPMVTHMPWAEPVAAPPPPSPPPAAPSVSAKKVPWSWRKTPKPAAPPARKDAEAVSSDTATWALPKGAAAAQTEMAFARESLPPEDKEPTAEQLVAYLSRLTARHKEPPAPVNPLTPYKARPLSFEPTRWETIQLQAQAHPVRYSLAAVALALLLGTAYLLRLVSLNAAIDRDWHALETALHERYALAPGYVGCITAFSDHERYTLALTEHSLAAWHAARTDPEIAAAAAQMERTLSLLSKVMKRCEQEVAAPDQDQIDSSTEFARLETLREQSRSRTSGLVQRYNTEVAQFNDKVDGVPGGAIAWIAHLHPRPPIFGGVRD